MRNAFVLNIYEKTTVVQFINIQEHYLITNPIKSIIIHKLSITSSPPGRG